MAKTTFYSIRKMENLATAWRHVRKSAFNSSNPKIRGEAAEFEHRINRNLRKIHEGMRRGSLNLPKDFGVLADQKKREAQGKDARPIVVAAIENRVIHRAILQVLQPRRTLDISSGKPRFEVHDDPRLGFLNNVAKSRFGCGGLIRPYGGVAPAIQVILSAIKDGATHYYISDLPSFFTTIPRQPVLDKLASAVDTLETVALFDSGLEVELTNSTELGPYLRLFPSQTIGVPQGSSLSAFAGNVLLYDIDHEINAMPGITLVRYIDDVIVLAENLEDLTEAIEKLSELLGNYGISLYGPEHEKSKTGVCSSGLEYLGVYVRGDQTSPTKKSVDNVLDTIDQTLKASKEGLGKALRKKAPIETDLSVGETLSRVRRRVSGWTQAYKFCTDQNQVLEVQNKVARKASSYISSVQTQLKGEKDVVRGQAFGGF